MFNIAVNVQVSDTTMLNNAQKAGSKKSFLKCRPQIPVPQLTKISELSLII
jgi:hypothetical protein